MNKKTKLVLELLRTKASSLGFNKEELEGAATTIASNLGVDDDATDEALNAAVEKTVAVYLPILELSQKNANRIITKNKEEREKAEAEAKAKAEAEAAAKAAKAEEERRNSGIEIPKEFKREYENLSKQFKEQSATLKKQQEEISAFRNEFEALKSDRLKEIRENRLNELVKDTGVYGARIKKNYAKMSFDSDEDFEEFIGGVQDDIKAFNQERADKGLEILGAPGVGEAEKERKQEPMSDAEIDALASLM